MVVLAHHPLGFLRIYLLLSSHEPLICKSVPASHLALTSSRLCEGASLPSVGLAGIHVFKVQQLHIYHHQT